MNSEENTRASSCLKATWEFVRLQAMPRDCRLCRETVSVLHTAAEVLMIAVHRGMKLGSLCPFTVCIPESSHFSFIHAGYFSALSSPITQIPAPHPLSAFFSLQLLIEILYFYFYCYPIYINFFSWIYYFTYNISYHIMSYYITSHRIA
jgi:hypothetical protein